MKPQYRIQYATCLWLAWRDFDDAPNETYCLSVQCRNATDDEVKDFMNKNFTVN